NIDRGRILAASVHREDSLCRRVVDNCVGIGSSLDGRFSLEGFEIENGDRIRATVARESPAGIGCDGYAMNALRIWNIADDLAAIGVEHHNMGTMRDIDAPSGTIDGHVVPTFVAPDGNSLCHAIVRGSGTRNLRRHNRKHRKESNGA